MNTAARNQETNQLVSWFLEERISFDNPWFRKTNYLLKIIWNLLKSGPETVGKSRLLFLEILGITTQINCRLQKRGKKERGNILHNLINRKLIMIWEFWKDNFHVVKASLLFWICEQSQLWLINVSKVWYSFWKYL